MLFSPAAPILPPSELQNTVAGVSSTSPRLVGSYVPTSFPPRPSHIHPVDPAILEKLDFSFDLQGIPVPFIQDVLLAIAPGLRAGIEATTPILPSNFFSGYERERNLPCIFPCHYHPTAPGSLPPTHLLLLPFSGEDDLPSPLLSVHALPWAIRSAVLAPLLVEAAPSPLLPQGGTNVVVHTQPLTSATFPPPRGTSTVPSFVHPPPSQPSGLTLSHPSPPPSPPPSLPLSLAHSPSLLYLPLVSLPFPLPSRQAFNLLRRWVAGELEGQDELEDELEEELLCEEEEQGEGDEEDGEKRLKKRIERILGVRETAVLLEVADDGLWEALEIAWEEVWEEAGGGHEVEKKKAAGAK
ncbi:hypothetical protein JCM8547_001786 [Rhodosporidiobolus lusitaniae]